MTGGRGREGQDASVIPTRLSQSNSTLLLFRWKSKVMLCFLNTDTQWSAYKRGWGVGVRVWSYTSEQYCGPKHWNNNTTLSQNIRTAPIQKYINKMHRKVCIQILWFESYIKSQQGEDIGERGNKHNLSMYIQTTVEHYYYIVLLLFFLLFWAQVCWYICAEVTLFSSRGCFCLYLCSSRSSCSLPLMVNDRSCPSSSTSTRSWPFSTILVEERTTRKKGRARGEKEHMGLNQTLPTQILLKEETKD